MKLEALENRQIEAFVDYCRTQRNSLDDSFLHDEDLVNFKPNMDNPTYVVTDPSGKIMGAASLIMDDYNRRGKKARFRIFHCESANQVCYEQLLEALLPHTAGLTKLFIFVPTINKYLTQAIEKLDFQLDRYSFLLTRDVTNLPEINLPENYSIRSFRPGLDENSWAAIRNAGFANLKGNETPITSELVSKMLLEKDYLEGGMMFLYNGNVPIGIVRGTDDEYEGAPIMNIGPLALLPEYQGKGLGRSLLRAALHLAKEKSYNRTVLAVNGENERAKSLYTSEGFQQAEAVACFQFDLKNTENTNEHP